MTETSISLKNKQEKCMTEKKLKKGNNYTT